MRLFIQVLDDNNTCRFDQHIEVDDELFQEPFSDKVTLAGVKTAIDFQLYQETEKRAEAKQT
jgi:hypothetical protein